MPFASPYLPNMRPQEILGLDKQGHSQANSRENPFLHIRVRSLLLVSIVLFVALVLTLAVAEFLGLNIEDAIVDPLGYDTILGLLCLWSLQRCRQLHIRIESIIGKIPRNQKWWPIINLVIILFMFSLGVFQLSYSLIGSIAPSFVQAVLNEKIFRPDSETSLPILYRLLTIISLVIVEPATKEFLFLGILFQRWTTKWGIRTALLVSAFVFGIFHENVIGLSIFGLVMALIYIKTRTLIVPIICHGANNALAILLQVILPHSDKIETVYTVSQFCSKWWLGGLYVLLAAPWLVLFIHENWPSEREKIPYLNHIDMPEV